MRKIADMKVDLDLKEKKWLSGFVSYSDFDIVRVNVNTNYLLPSFSTDRYCNLLGRIIFHEWLHQILLEEYEERKRLIIQTAQNKDIEKLMELYWDEERKVDPVAKMMFSIYLYGDTLLEMMYDKIKFRV